MLNQTQGEVPGRQLTVRFRQVLMQGLIALIRLWQLTRHFRPPVCRFYPSCSTYGIQALQKYGVTKGSWLTVKRICRCHPFHAGGYDPLE